MFHLYYTDSSCIRHKIEFEANEYDNLMELIWDRGYEDWGDCRGRAWCGTCHIQIHNKVNTDSPDLEEKKRMHLLSNKTDGSRLSCQLFLTEHLHEAEIEFIGDD